MVPSAVGVKETIGATSAPPLHLTGAGAAAKVRSASLWRAGRVNAPVETGAYTRRPARLAGSSFREEELLGGLPQQPVAVGGAQEVEMLPYQIDAVSVQVPVDDLKRTIA